MGDFQPELHVNGFEGLSFMALMLSNRAETEAAEDSKMVVIMFRNYKNDGFDLSV